MVLYFVMTEMVLYLQWRRWSSICSEDCLVFVIKKMVLHLQWRRWSFIILYYCILFYLCPSVRPAVRPSVLPSVQDIFLRTFLSNCWWEKSDIWSQASYRYTISWEAFLDPSDSYFLFADFVDFQLKWRVILQLLDLPFLNI